MAPPMNKNYRVFRLDDIDEDKSTGDGQPEDDKRITVADNGDFNKTDMVVYPPLKHMPTKKEKTPKRATVDTKPVTSTVFSVATDVYNEMAKMMKGAWSRDRVLLYILIGVLYAYCIYPMMVQYAGEKDLIRSGAMDRWFERNCRTNVNSNTCDQKTEPMFDYENVTMNCDKVAGHKLAFASRTGPDLLAFIEAHTLVPVQALLNALFKGLYLIAMQSMDLYSKLSTFQIVEETKSTLGGMLINGLGAFQGLFWGNTVSKVTGQNRITGSLVGMMGGWSIFSGASALAALIPGAKV
jgi:hypothetical protein